MARRTAPRRGPSSPRVTSYTPPAGRRPGRPRPALFAAGAAVLVAAVAWPAWRAASGSSGGSPEAVAPRPLAYHVVYAVHVSAGVDQTSTYEVLSVRRPFSVSDLTYAAPPGPGVEPQGGTITTESELFDLTTSGVRAVAGRVPALGTGDQALLAERADLVARHLAVRTGHQVVDGRGCDVYEFFEPPAGTIKPLAAPAGRAANHDYLCIDPQGIVLGEQWTYNGKVVEARQAVSVSTDPLDATVASTSGAGPAPAQAPTATALDAAGLAKYAPAIASPSPPAGYRAAGVYEVVLPDPQHPQTVLDTSAVWVFTRGPDVVTVESGTGQLPWLNDTGTTTPARLTGLGPAATGVASDGPDVRVDLGDAHWARVRGTADVATLVAYADGLRRA